MLCVDQLFQSRVSILTEWVGLCYYAEMLSIMMVSTTFTLPVKGNYDSTHCVTNHVICHNTVMIFGIDVQRGVVSTKRIVFV